MSEKGIVQKICSGIVKRKNIIIAVFLAIFVFSLFSMNWVKVEDDMVYFLDYETESRQCLDIDSEEFDTFGNMYFMVSHVTKEDTENIINQLDGISNVAYYTQQVRQEDDGKGYTAAFYLSFVSYFEDSASVDTYNEVADIAHQYDSNYVYSDLNYNLEDWVNQQMTIVITLVSAVVVIILLLTSRSFAEVPVIIAVFVFAAIINLGTNFLYGTVSLVTNAVAVTMQLALSIDYAIIFTNRYWEARENMTVKESVINSLKGAAPEILASSLTTIAGLVAMTFMTFGIGLDMGIVLIKAIAISMLTIFLFMPGLIIIFGKAMDKSKHKRLLPKFSFLGKFAHFTRFVVPVLFAGIIVVGYILFNRANYIYDEVKAPVKHPLKETVAYLAIREELNFNQVEIIVPRGDFGKEKELIEKLSANPAVTSANGIANTEAVGDLYLGDDIGVSDIMELAEVDEITAKGVLALTLIEQGNTDALSDKLDTMKAPLIDVFSCISNHIDDENLEISEDQKSQLLELSVQLDRVKREMLGENYSRIILVLDAPELDSDETFAILDQLQETAEEYYPNGTHIAGYSVIYRDFSQSFQKDKMIISVLSIALVMIILFFTFRSPIMPVLLTLVIQGSVWINFGLHSYFGNSVYFIGYLIVSAIMMGSNIDYAIVISSRFRELMNKGMEKKEAMTETLRFSLPTVLTSGGIIALAGALIYEFVGTGVVAGFGIYVATGTLVTIFLVLFVLPQILLITESLVKKTTFAWPSFKGNRKACRTAIAVACVITIILSTVCFAFVGTPIMEKLSIARADQNTINSMTVDATRVSKSLDSFPYYDLVTQYLTGVIAPDEILNAKKQLADGKSQLEEGQTQFDIGKKEYEDGLQQYNSGQSELIAGEIELNKNTALYNQYMADYQAGKKQYEYGLKQYNDGKAQYEAGLAEYEAALKEYKTSKQALDEYNELYGEVISGYQEYLDLQAQYDDAIASGDTDTASQLELRVIAARLLYEGSLPGGVSISSLLAQYESAQAQLADAERQLADAKAQLDDAKAQLDAAEKELATGKKELEDAEKQLADANIQLIDGAVQLEDGKYQLADAKQQLDEGKAELDAGEKALSEYYTEYEEGQNQLNEAEKMLEEANENYATNSVSLGEIMNSKAEIGDKLENLNCINTVKANSFELDNIELYNAAKEYCDKEVNQETNKLILIVAFCGIVALLGIAGIVLLIIRKNK